MGPLREIVTRGLMGAPGQRGTACGEPRLRIVGDGVSTAGVSASKISFIGRFCESELKITADFRSPSSLGLSSGSEGGAGYFLSVSLSDVASSRSGEWPSIVCCVVTATTYQTATRARRREAADRDNSQLVCGFLKPEGCELPACDGEW